MYYQCYFTPGPLVNGILDYKWLKPILVSHIEKPGRNSKIQQLDTVQALGWHLYHALDFVTRRL